MISLIMLGSVINYLTRSTLAVAAPTVLKELHISTQEYSWIIGAFRALSWHSRSAGMFWMCSA